MSLIRFLIILAIGTILSWTALIVVVTTLDPFTNPVVAPMLFFVSLWLAMIGTMTLIGFFVRHWFEKTGVPFQQTAIALRQAALISTGLAVLLFLQRAQFLNGWTFILVILLIAGVELFFLAGHTQRSANHNPVS